MARWLAATAASVALFGLCALAFPLLPDPTGDVVAAIGGYAIAYVCVAACVLAVGAAAPDLKRIAIGVVAVAAIALVSMASASPDRLHGATVLCLLLLAGTTLGAAIGWRIESAGHLLPVAIVSSLADMISVLTPGAPSDVVSDSPALLSILAISWPMPGTEDLIAVLGVGDIAFVAVYFAASRRHALSMRRTAIALTAGLLVTAVVVMSTAIPIPALPFLGVAMLIAHPATRVLPDKDRRPAAIGLVLIVLGLAALVLLRRAS